MLINQNGFSPSQIVFRKGTNLPNIMTDILPALETKTNSADLPLDIATLHLAREAFRKVESSAKIEVAIKKKTWQTRNKWLQQDSNPQPLSS